MKEQKKKILLATGIYPPEIGGPATYVKILEKELPKYDFDINVITYSDLKSQDKNQNLFVIDKNQNVFFRYFKYFFQIWRLRKKIDFVYVQGPVSEGLPTALACRLMKKEYILKIVGDYAWEQGRQRFGVSDNLDEFQNKKYGFKVELFRKIEIWVARNARLIITPSDYLKNIVKKWGIKETKIKVIYNAVKNSSLDISKKDAKDELGLKGDIILSSGRLVPWKGFDLLIDLMPELLKVNSDFCLVIVGEGTERKILESRSEKQGLKGKVIFFGSVEQQVLWKYMKASEMFVLNTGYEGLAHILIEAMQNDLPIVTTKAGGNKEVVDDGINGVLVDYNNAEQFKNEIINVWKDKEKTLHFVKNAKKSLDKFEKEKMINNIVNVLKNFK